MFFYSQQAPELMGNSLVKAGRNNMDNMSDLVTDLSNQNRT